jgi:hypothetical protein
MKDTLRNVLNTPIASVHNPFPDIARMIADGEPPQWLPEALDSFASTVENDVYEGQPKRSEVRKDIRQLKQDTLRFAYTVKRISKRRWNLAADDPKCWEDTWNALRRVAAMCDKSLTTIPAKRGREKLPGRVTCCLIVIEAWACMRGSPPGRNNEKAVAAVDAYWRACIGGPARGWQRHLETALATHNPLRDHIHDEIRRLAGE